MVSHVFHGQAHMVRDAPFFRMESPCLMVKPQHLGQVAAPFVSVISGLNLGAGSGRPKVTDLISFGSSDRDIQTSCLVCFWVHMVGASGWRVKWQKEICE